MTTDSARIDTVHVIFKTHLDIGFTDFAENVVQQYMELFIPKAIDASELLADASGSSQFVWTTGSWLIHRYLRTAAAEERERMREAIRKGYIVWHALPFTTHTELLDAELLEYGISLSEELDRQFGKTTIAAKMTDVPGHTIGMLPILAKHGIRYLHLGVNPASKVPAVPDIFLWRAEDGSELIVNYSGTYGDILELEGFRDCLVFAHTGDNSGPPSAEDIRGQFSELALRFPRADIRASSLDTFAAKLWALKDRLPVIGEEIGDTWIHGAGSDPLKVGQFRELLRLRSKWTAAGSLRRDSEEYRELSENLLLVAEHTWGLDVKKYLPDFRHYDTSDFQEARRRDRITDKDIPDKYKYIGSFALNERDKLSANLYLQEKTKPGYRTMETSWDEQRAYIFHAIQALADDRRHEAIEKLAELQPGFSLISTEQGESLNLQKPYRLGDYTVTFGPDGSISALLDRFGTNWAAAEGIGGYRYETFGFEAYQNWFRTYISNLPATHPWADADFGKPGIEYSATAKSALYAPVALRSVWLPGAAADHVFIQLEMPNEASNTYGAPSKLLAVYSFEHQTGAIELSLSWFGKEACRLPEASWCTMGIKVDNPNLWTMDKLGSAVSPLRVVKHGNRNLHAVGKELRYHGADGIVKVETLDAPLISFGERRLLQFDSSFPPLENGFHVNLHNNVWGTNFPMWFEEDLRFRFRITIQPNAC